MNSVSRSDMLDDPHGKELSSWSLVVAVNDDQVLRATLLASPEVDSKCQLITRRNFSSAAKAYNSAIAEAENELIVFAHQDVYLPPGWLDRLRGIVACLAAEDPNWGVLGVVGVTRQKEIAGHCYSTGLGSVVGRPFFEPTEVQSLDELVLIVRLSSGLQFDDQLAGFHFYGTSICLEAAARGMKSYIVPAFCIHNSNGVKGFLPDFWRGYFYLRRKWWHKLPVMTTCTTITKGCAPFIQQTMKDVRGVMAGHRAAGRRSSDVAHLYQMLQRRKGIGLEEGKLW